MDLIQQNENILLVWDSSFDLERSGINAELLKSQFDASIKFENVQRLNMSKSLMIFPELQSFKNIILNGIEYF